MLDYEVRAAILKLQEAGCAIRKIARELRVSRKTVRKVLSQGTSEVPQSERTELCAEHEEQIRAEHDKCAGNLVRVAEELEADGIRVNYSTLTAFCRRRGIGVKPKKLAGRYHFGPGEEMQHDTSPHDVQVGGRRRRVQCASLVLCFSRLLFAQCYCTFNRFYCRIFLTEALRYFEGAAGRCMVDNSSVVIGHGTGAEAVPAPQMEAFSDRFGFYFAAHELGDANRSARVERPFDYIERNFYAGRTFVDLDDLNAQLRQWCDRVNLRTKRHIRAVPRELYQTERQHLKSLPAYIPEVYRLHQRLVDVEGYVTLHTNRYSAPVELLGRRVQVRESQDMVRIVEGHRLVCEHARLPEGQGRRATLPQHRGVSRRRQAIRRLPDAKVGALRAGGAELGAMVDALVKRHGGRAIRHVRTLHRMYLEYPTEALTMACGEALQYGLLDLQRVEKMVLRNIAGDFFVLSLPGTEEDNDE
jgi:transposase